MSKRKHRPPVPMPESISEAYSWDFGSRPTALTAGPLSERMLNDGMYPGIVEKWADEVAALEEKLLDVLDVAIARGEKLGYEDAAYRALVLRLKDQKKDMSKV